MTASPKHLDSLPHAAELRAWIEGSSAPRMSLYLPLAHDGNFDRNAQQRAEAVREIEKKAAALGIDAGAWSERVRSLEIDPRRLEVRVATLAVFADAAAQRVVALRAALPYGVTVGRSFALRPLLGAIARSPRYRLLVVSAQRIALYDGGPDGLAPTPRTGIPKSLEDALGSVTTEKELRVRGTRAGGAAPAFYSHGGGQDERKLDWERFHVSLAASLDAALPDDGAPLVLAGTDEHRAALRKLAALPGLLDDGIHGNVDTASLGRLHERAWPVVERWCAARIAACGAEFERARNRGKGVDLPGDVGAAAIAGRVRRLWLDAERRIPGRIDLATGATLEATGDDDVLDSLAEIALTRGGEVIPVPFPALPSASGCAAQLH